MWRRADRLLLATLLAAALLLTALPVTAATAPSTEAGIEPAPSAQTGAASPAPARQLAERAAERSLAELLRRLQREGLPLVFTEALVDPALTVPAAVAERLLERLAALPAATPGESSEGAPADPAVRRLLDELLGRHRLTLRPAADGSLVVVLQSDASRPSGPPGRAEGVEPAPPDAPEPPVGRILDRIVVTPSSFSIFGDDRAAGGSRQTLSRDEVDRVPHLADDLFRVIGLLPGAAGGDISAESYIRGGDQDEMLVMVDGLEVYEPFHLRDFQSPFSIVDSEIVDGVELMAGGFPVEHGGRMSAVLDIRTAEPAGPLTGTAGVSLVNARLGGEQAFENRPGGWLISARGGYLDYVLDFAAENDDEFELSPSYYDVLGKLRFLAGERTTLSLQLLAARDDIEFRDLEDPRETNRADAAYGNGYLWLDAATGWSPRLTSRTVLSAGTVERERSAEVAEGRGRTGCSDCQERDGAVRDDRSFDFIGLRQDWSYALAGGGDGAEHGDGDGRHLLKWGFDVRFLSADYRYRRTGIILAPLLTGERVPVAIDTDLRLSPSGDDLGLYLADRFRLSDRLTIEAGLRWDRESYSGEGGRVSPRLNLLATLGPATSLRAAWGHYSQAQGIHELQIEDGVDRFQPAQRAEHRVLSLEHRFADGIAVRAELYEKRLSDLRPRYENLFEPIDLIPEAAPDRVEIAPERGLARGLELLVKGSAGGDPGATPDSGRFQWWASYILSSVDDVVDGVEVPRSWDQTHALTVSANWRLSPRWNLNAVWLYHTGWPTTPVTAELVEQPDGSREVVPQLGRRNSDRYPDYHRLDLRATRTVTLDRGRLSFFLEVTNAYDRDNVRAISDFDYRLQPDGSVAVVREQERWLPRIPSFGVAWSF